MSHELKTRVPAGVETAPILLLQLQLADGRASARTASRRPLSGLIGMLRVAQLEHFSQGDPAHVDRYCQRHTLRALPRLSALD